MSDNKDAAPTKEEAAAAKKAAREAAAKEKAAAREQERAEKAAARERERVEREAERERKKAERDAERRARKEQKARKERVIHTRVPESLDQELKERANALGVSVSNLVRNALNHTFGLVEDIIGDTSDVARAAKGDGSPAPAAAAAAAAAPAPAAEPTVFGWQTCRLAMNALCDTCNDILPKGTEAAVAVTNIPARRPVALCLTCLEKELGA